jgi:LytR cell envelope-related transcriptional attenuator
MQTTERPPTGQPRGSSPARGVVLVAVAAVLGFFILRAIDDTGGGTDVADGVSTEEVAGGEGATDTTAAETTESTPPPTRPVAEVIVLVANGSGVDGAGTRQVEALRGGGYQVLDATNAPQAVEATQVWATSGFEADAAALAASIGAPEGAVQPMPNPPPMDPQGANVLVVLGPDLAAAAES